MPMTTKRPIQGWAQKERLQFFKEHFRVGSEFLEVESGSGWLKPELVQGRCMRIISCLFAQDRKPK